MEWIDLKEQKPSIDEKVIALANDGREIEATYRYDEMMGEGLYFNHIYGSVSYFTHWKPSVAILSN